MIKNFLTTPKQTQPTSHGGTGPVELYEIWGKDDFQSNVDFIDRVVIPPGTVVGTHKHGNNEEMYIVLSGAGTMTIEGEVRQIKAGDMILNTAFGEHGLVNDTSAPLDLLVIQVGMD